MLSDKSPRDKYFILLTTLLIVAILSSWASVFFALMGMLTFGEWFGLFTVLIVAWFLLDKSIMKYINNVKYSD